MTDAETKHARCRFETKDYSDGTFWVMVNIDRPGVGLPGDGFIGFEFKNKISMKEADDFTKLLNNNLKSISLTTFK